MVKKLLPVILATWLLSGTISGEPLAEPAWPAAPSLVTRIRLLNERYRIGEPLEVHVSVENTGNHPVTITLSRFLHRNFEFRVRSLANLPVKPRTDFLLESDRESTSPDSGRPLTLLPGEKFGRVIDAAAWLDLVNSDRYEITGYFYARPKRSPLDAHLASNSLRFRLDPPEPVLAAIAAGRKQKIARDNRVLSPSETVDAMIEAKQRRDWSGYFRHIDLVRLIQTSFPAYRERYQAAPFSRRQEIVDEFREFLKSYPAETLERHFTSQAILRRDEETLNETAEVTSRIEYRTGELLEKKLYYFSLYRKQGRWYVSRYSVQNTN
jgi:hypothetical protein